MDILLTISFLVAAKCKITINFKMLIKFPFQTHCMKQTRYFCCRVFPNYILYTKWTQREHWLQWCFVMIRMFGSGRSVRFRATSATTIHLLPGGGGGGGGKETVSNHLNPFAASNNQLRILTLKLYFVALLCIKSLCS